MQRHVGMVPIAVGISVVGREGHADETTKNESGGRRYTVQFCNESNFPAGLEA